MIAIAQTLPARAQDANPDGAQPAGDATPEYVGQFITISAPMTDRLDLAVRRQAEQAVTIAKREGKWPVLVFEIEPGKRGYGRTLDLAKFISGTKLAGATTVAYIKERVTGHGVLLALACEEIVMAEDAQLGNGSEHESPLTGDVRSGYVEIFSRRRSVPSEAVALGLLDPDLEVVMIDSGVGREFYTAADAPPDAPNREVLFKAGEPGIITGAEARHLGLIKLLAASRQEVAREYGLPQASLSQDPTVSGDWRTVRIDVKYNLTPESATQIHRLVEDAVNDEKNFICLWIDSPGGAPAESLALAGYLASFNSDERRTVAYIPKQARADAALIALACDQVVMLPDAVLGGPGDARISSDELPAMVEAARVVAEKKFRSPALAAAMLDPDLTVYRYQRAGQQGQHQDFMTEQDLLDRPDQDQWLQGGEVTVPGKTFEATGREAHEEYGLVFEVVDNFNAFKALFGLERDPVLLEPGWADTLIEALRSPGVALFLLFIGGMAFYSELEIPSGGAGFLIGSVCFLIYFWSNYLGGTAAWLEMLLFVGGVVCLLVEFFVIPGMGIFGLAGGAMMISSLVLASQTFLIPHNEYQMHELARSLAVICASGLGVVLGVTVFRRYLPTTPYLNRLMLQPPTAEEQGLSSDQEQAAEGELVGRRGKCLTSLAPSGKIRLGDRVYDVVADGEFIDRGTTVTVVEARGNRIIVRSAPRV